MAIFQRETQIHAPFDAVWAFHSTVEGLTRVTPNWAGLHVEDVWRPDGERPGRNAQLTPGTTLRLSMRPLGAGPQVEWVSQVTAREEHADRALLRDEMRQGPFRRWHHTHAVRRDGDATVLRDRVEYATPFGRVADEAVRAGLAAVFRDRHRRTRAVLERGRGGRATPPPRQQ